MSHAVAKGIYDPLTHTCAEDPYPIYRRLRDEFPLYRNEERDCWVLSRFDDVRAASRDFKRFSSEGGVELGLPAHILGIGDFIESDPPRHDRMRRVVHEHFNPKRISMLEQEIRERVERLVAPMLERGSGDMMRELAVPLPMLTILRFLGFPESDTEMVRGWLTDWSERLPGTDELPPVVIETNQRLVEYLGAVTDEYRHNPREDVLTAVALAAADGRLAEEEVSGICLELLIAGWGTTTGLLSNAFYLLAQHADQRTILAADTAAIPAGVEEILRFEAPVQNLMRTTTEDIEMYDTVIPRGGRVILLYAAANRDDRRWDDPDRFDVTRPPRRNLAFGEGIHHCLGAPLARLEARIALEVVLARAPTYTLTSSCERTQSSGVVRKFEQLPVAV